MGFVPAAQAEAPAVAAQSQRLPQVEGGNNFRDIGGYVTADGRRVRWSKVYRSGAMDQLTPKGFEQVKALGITTNVDFRSTDERTEAPVKWPEALDMTTLTVDYGMDYAAFSALFADGPPSAERARDIMAGFYRDTPFRFAGQYASVIRAIIEDDGAVVYNCSAGKDRTGVATAVLLRLLGVPYDAIVEDYLLSNVYYKPHIPGDVDGSDPRVTMMSRLPPEVLQAIMGVDARYLAAAFEAIDTREGGWTRYVREDLGLSEADEARLKAVMLY